MGPLNLIQIAENQAAAYVTSNDADADLEKALCECKSDHDASEGDFTVSDADFRQNWFHLIGGSPGAAFDVTLPALKRPFMVLNLSGRTATLKTGGGAAGQVMEGETRFFYNDGTHIHSLTDKSEGGAGLPTYSGAQVGLSTDFSVSNSSNTAVDWDTDSHDSGGYFDDANPSRFTVPVGISTVILGGQVRWDSNGSGRREILINKNGSGAYAGRAFLHADAAPTLLMNFTSPPLEVTAGDYFELVTWQDSGSTRDIQSNVATWFAIHAVG